VAKFGEVEISDPLWRVPAVFPTGDGGLEVATFTEFAGQDRNKHEVSTEIYTVLKGKLLMYINDEGPYELDATDEVVILPGTIHEVVQTKCRSIGDLKSIGDLNAVFPSLADPGMMGRGVMQ
jgi:quercetin dioxygenase-like cupin family protein